MRGGIGGLTVDVGDRWQRNFFLEKFLRRTKKERKKENKRKDFQTGNPRSRSPLYDILVSFLKKKEKKGDKRKRVGGEEITTGLDPKRREYVRLHKQRIDISYTWTSWNHVGFLLFLNSYSPSFYLSHSLYPFIPLSPCLFEGSKLLVKSKHIYIFPLRTISHLLIQRDTWKQSTKLLIPSSREWKRERKTNKRYVTLLSNFL